MPPWMAAAKTLKYENMLNLRYRGQFLAIDGTLWQADILQEGYAGAVGELTFEADEPLVIEWRETRKEEVICSSEATLRIESPGDRTFTDLYAIEPGQIRLDVRRNGTLYWSGTLDTEFYEEPYERARLYPVTLTFSDFGILDRLKFKASGILSLDDILRDALLRSAINDTMSIDTSLISTALKGSSTPLSLDDLSVMALNFYDEDGDALTLREAIEGVLQPLGLKMQQRAGRVWIYDLNGLYEGGARRAIEWDGAEQTLGTDRVYNNAKITWSPYVKSGNLMEEECWVKAADRNYSALNQKDGVAKDGCTVFTYHASGDPDDWGDLTDSGFTLWLSREGKNASLTDTALRFFKILSQQDGEDAEGVAVMWPGWAPTGGDTLPVAQATHGACGGCLSAMQGYLGSGVGGVLWKSREVQLPAGTDPSGLRLRLTMEMLMDCRFNPFEEASAKLGLAARQKVFHEHWNSRGNFVYVPVSVMFRPDGSETTYVWANQTSVRSYERRRFTTQLAQTLGSWVTCDMATDGTPAGYGYLCWYDGSDRAEASAVLGWKRNRPAISAHTEPLGASLKSAGEGQWLPMPTGADLGGRLWIEVRERGWMLADGGVEPTEAVDTRHLWQREGDYCITPWCLFKLPQIEVLKAQAYDQELDDSDVEYQAEINPDAREDIELQTICGTADEPVPMARGAYLLAESCMPVCHLTRAGRTATAEELLIGTLYSQYATRHTTLEGEARIDPLGLATYSERNQGDRRFMALSEIQDVRMGTAECLYCELSADEYDKG